MCKTFKLLFTFCKAYENIKSIIDVLKKKSLPSKWMSHRTLANLMHFIKAKGLGDKRE